MCYTTEEYSLSPHFHFVFYDSWTFEIIGLSYTWEGQRIDLIDRSTVTGAEEEEEMQWITYYFYL